MLVVKRAQSAYFLFSAEKRKQIALDNPGLRVGDVQKLITAQWKELTPEQKEVYLELAAKDKERYEREKIEIPVDVTAQKELDATDAEENLCVYPLGRVKRIIQSDPDMNKVSREALIAISKASELFAQHLATKSYEQTLYSNKRQIKPSDVTRAIQSTSVLDWLRDDFPEVKAPKHPNNVTEKTSRKSKEISPDAPSVSTFFQQQAMSESAANSIDEHGDTEARGEPTDTTTSATQHHQ